MICVTKTVSKRMAGWVLGWLKRNTANWAKQLYAVAILLYSGWIIWQVISRTAFIPQSTDPTLIQLDLLQAMAFLGGVVGLNHNHHSEGRDHEQGLRIEDCDNGLGRGRRPSSVGRTTIYDGDNPRGIAAQHRRAYTRERATTQTARDARTYGRPRSIRTILHMQTAPPGVVFHRFFGFEFRRRMCRFR